MNPVLRRLVYIAARLRGRARFRWSQARFEVSPGVLNPTLFRASRLFAEQALRQAPAGPATVLELGCGCGLAAVALARAGHAVTALDRNPAAARDALRNARTNGVRVDVLVSDWDAALLPDRRFDYVIANPPFLSTEPPALRTALYAGADLEVLTDVLAALRRRTRANGHALLASSSLSGRARIEALVVAAGLNVLATQAVRGFGERYHFDRLAAERP